MTPIARWTPEKNMCKLPDDVTNSRVDDLRERAEQYIDHALRYACMSWHEHFTNVDEHLTRTSGITSALYCFLEKFLSWLEVLSILGVVMVAVDALEAAAERLKVSRVSMPNESSEFTDLNRNRQLLTLSTTAFIS